MDARLPTDTRFPPTTLQPSLRSTTQRGTMPQKKGAFGRRVRLVLSYGPDWIITIVLVLLTAYLTNKGGYKREFSLTDTSIQHTYTVEERIKFWEDILYAGAVPLGIIVVIGMLRRSFWDCQNGALGLLLSVSLATTATNLIKITVGRPRPDLIDRCQPVANASNGVPYGLATLAVCSVQSGHIIDDGFKSFPSGHTSFAFAGLGFLSLFLAGKLHLFASGFRAIKAWVSLVPLMGATLIAISRSMDYRHHATDILAGGLLGILTALLTYHLCLFLSFRTRSLAAAYLMLHLRTDYPPLSSAQCHLPFSPPAQESKSSLRPVLSGSRPTSAEGEYEEELEEGTVSRSELARANRKDFRGGHAYEELERMRPSSEGIV